MSDLKSLISKARRRFMAGAVVNAPRGRVPQEARQRKLMSGALLLLLVALSIVLWKDRDFWFPDTATEEARRPTQGPAVGKSAVTQRSASAPHRARIPKATRPALKQSASKQPAPKYQPAPQEIANRQSPEPEAAAAEEPGPPGATVSARTVLPPLEVEVVAGDTHRMLRPGSDSVRVNLQPDTPPAPGSQAAKDSATAAEVTSAAAERVQMSAGASAVVETPVRPNYPLLARQMQVQGSVILQALIGKDGVIQNLQVVSGPRILAPAAQDAVRQWHFKPHYEGQEPVETQAKITVNFTISTN